MSSRDDEGGHRKRQLAEPRQHRPAHVTRYYFFFSSRRRHTRCSRDWSSDVCSSDLQSLTRRTPENQQSHRNSKTKQGRVTLQSSKPCNPERVDSLRDNRSSRPELLANRTKNLFPPRILAQRVSKERKVQKRGGGIVPRQNGGFQRSAERAQVRPKRKVSAQNPSKCHSQVGARVNPALACAPSHTGNWLASCEKP